MASGNVLTQQHYEYTTWLRIKTFNKAEIKDLLRERPKQAFESIDTNILHQKLSNIGIRGISFNWFKRYIQRRKHSHRRARKPKSRNKIWSTTSSFIQQQF